MLHSIGACVCEGLLLDKHPLFGQRGAQRPTANDKPTYRELLQTLQRLGGDVEHSLEASGGHFTSESRELRQQ